MLTHLGNKFLSDINASEEIVLEPVIFLWEKRETCDCLKA